MFNEDKTRITHPRRGFDFLGFTIRRYRGTLLITPSKTAVRRLRERLPTQMRSLRGTDAETVIARLNPIAALVRVDHESPKPACRAMNRRCGSRAGSK